MSAQYNRFDGVIADEHLLYEFEQTLATVSKIVGRKWNPVIVYVLLTEGPLGYATLQERIDGLSSKVLSGSLLNLEQNGLVDRAIVSEKPFRVEYSLNDHGKSLRPIIAAMGNWGMQHLSPPEPVLVVPEAAENRSGALASSRVVPSPEP